mgnify:CR=1 FL=1
MNTITTGNPYTHEERTRTSYGRKDLLYGYGVCDWCGQIKHRLYSYDGNQKIFCNRECYRSYVG